MQARSKVFVDSGMVYDKNKSDNGKEKCKQY
jgi:hypothetical protein